jgi:hypothetical protein
MPKTPSILGLHLRYRIWIAEMNADITILRIFDDYLESLADGKNKQDHRSVTAEFKDEFVLIRKKMDELKHEMHLQKMKLAANTREGKTIDKKLYQTDNHAALKNHYSSYRRDFEKIKASFELIKDNWVD